jgi:hypothetical protein
MKSFKTFVEELSEAKDNYTYDDEGHVIITDPIHFKNIDGKSPSNTYKDYEEENEEDEPNTSGYKFDDEGHVVITDPIHFKNIDGKSPSNTYKDYVNDNSAAEHQVIKTVNPFEE